ncbi:ABC transporter ATP-binding protein [Streptococcus massiliensis]|uniref:Multidrug ABC transporter n=1 Tax=Streptococcus massiliensis TaxID=313439 RepID=A0A380KYR9_9STRE|nr:ATP-binding cassette domain-containing protein [Streptococcus massiliensis]SUN76419.1 multidrug ABC transporter [Streptococcus massiliensis]
MEHLIKLKNVCKKRGGKKILQNITFTAKGGRITAFLGPNGAGKSSTLRILLGLDRANSGEASFDDKEYRTLSQPLLLVGASFDGLAGLPTRKVYHHLQIIAASNGITKSRIDEVLELTGIPHKSRARLGDLSLGEGQRLGLAVALLGDPQFLVLDEPTNGLDPSGIKWFRKFIRQQADQGKTVLLSSHILSEIEMIADDLVLINHGKIIEQGQMTDVMQGVDTLEELFFNMTEEALS